MKKEITLGQALSIVLGLVIVLVGWGVSVEVRLATAKMQIETILEMKELVKEIHEKVIVHDVKINEAGTDYSLLKK